MKSCVSLTLASIPLLALPLAASETVIGPNYPGLFGPPSQVTVVPAEIPEGTPLGVQLNGQASGTLGDRWVADVSGGAVLGSNLAAEFRVAETGAQVALTGSALQFNLNNNPTSILGALGTGLGLSLNWTATAKLNAAGSELILAPNTVYHVSFDLPPGANLLNSTLAIGPNFSVELLDGANVATGFSGGGSLANILTLQLTPVAGQPTGTGRVTAEFRTSAGVSTAAPASLRFKGSALLPASLLGLNDNFATVTNLSVIEVDAYTTWASDQGLTNEADRLPDADPDRDGRNNLQEFALATDPSSGSHGDTYPAVGDPDGSGPQTSAFVMSFAVRSGAEFSASSGDQVATRDGATYRVEGSFDLVSWTQAVSEVTPNDAFTANLPDLPSGWDYRSFRVPGQTSDTRRAFLRLVIE